MHATVLNGAAIGAESLVGAGSLVPEGKSYPEGVLILGTPARVHRPLTAEERQRLRHSAAHYVAQAKAFREALQPIDSSSPPSDL
jgi:carbonic anhydrase/acetyltransferase-like protein (isoleucine patch superfamily)